MTYQTALIVDDSKLARITLRKKLEQRGLSVEMAESGVQALELLANKTVDIVFMDHLMPELDGFQTTQKIKANPITANIPVIMCTGKEYEGYLQEARSIGASNILSKPPENDALDLILSETPQASTSSPASMPPADASANTVASQSTALDTSTQSSGLSEADIESLVSRLVNESLKENLSSEISQTVSAQVANQQQQKLDQLNNELTERLNTLDGALQAVESKADDQTPDDLQGVVKALVASEVALIAPAQLSSLMESNQSEVAVDEGRFKATEDTVGRLTSQMVDMDSRLDDLTEKLTKVGESAAQPPVLEPQGGISLQDVSAENQSLREELSSLKGQLDELKASTTNLPENLAQNEGVSLDQIDQMKDELKSEMALELDAKFNAQAEAASKVSQDSASENESHALAMTTELKQSMDEFKQSVEEFKQSTEERLASQDAVLAAGDNIPTLQPEEAPSAEQSQVGDATDLNFDTHSDLQHQLLSDNNELKQSLGKMKMLAGGGFVLAAVSLLVQFVL